MSRHNPLCTPYYAVTMYILGVALSGMSRLGIYLGGDTFAIIVILWTKIENKLTAGIIQKMGHCIGGNFNIHIWA